jgi:hypothetical protein
MNDFLKEKYIVPMIFPVKLAKSAGWGIMLG